MATTIQISKHLQEELQKRKIVDKESYEEVIWDALEDAMEINNETKKEIEKAREEIKQGKFRTHAQIKKELGF